MNQERIDDPSNLYTEEEDFEFQEVESEEQELSYAELYGTALLNGEIIITIPAEEEERVKSGIKNFKSKQATRQKENGIIPDLALLIFTSSPSKEYTGCIDMSIQVKTKGTVKIKGMRIPENDFPA